MEKTEYKLIVSLPSLLFAAGPLIVLFAITVCKPKCYGNKVKSSCPREVCVTETLPEFATTKTDKCGGARSFKGVDITDGKTRFIQVIRTILYVFLLLFGGVTTLLFQFILLKISWNLPVQTSSNRLLFHVAADISRSCDQNKEAFQKECFKYDTWNKINEDPIDCNSTAVQNGTIDVICYRSVFNMELASGYDYGGFWLSLVILNVATCTVIIMIVVKFYSSFLLRTKQPQIEDI